MHQICESAALARTAGAASVGTKPLATPRSSPVRRACLTVRLVQRATTAPAQPLGEDEPQVFEACSALILQCRRMDLPVRVARCDEFEVDLPLGPGQSVGGVVQALYPAIQAWNARLRNSPWQFVLEG